MKKELSSCTEKVSYFLWEISKHPNALDLWYCAEDIGFFLEGNGIVNARQLRNILCLPKEDPGYIEFVRQIAYRVHIFTKDDDAVKNWFLAEKLLDNKEWFDAVLGLAKIYSEIRNGNYELAEMIRTDKFRKIFL